jgi:O-antigen/teichoic acid export membrane protein
MTSSPPPLRLGRKLPGWLIGSSVIAVAMGVMNVTTYLFTILAARLLGPAHYSELAAMMGLLMVATVLSLGLQATGARRVSAAPEMTPVIEQDILAVSYRAALALGVVSLVASPIISVVLHLNSPLTAAMLAITVVPVTVMGGQAGVLQGERRWTPLALIYLMTGVGRLACGLVGLLWSADALGAMVGVAVGAFFPTVVGWFALRHPTRVAENARSATEHVTTVAAGLIREVLHNSHALLAFFALSNADVVVARTTLSEHQAGLYAGGLILTKAVLFMPQFVVVIAFPSMASGVARRSTHIKSLGLVLGIGAVAVLGTAALSSLAVTFIGGPEYATLQGQLWAFAGLGTLLALIQIMVYDVVARQHKRAVFVIWAALLGLLAAIPFVATHTALLAVVTSVDVTLLVILLLVSLLRPAQTPPEPAERDTTIQPQ